MEVQMNKYQTPLTGELLQTLPEEVIEQLYDCLNNIPFIKNLVSPNRKYAKDLPRDSKGRIIVDLANPHIIEDADYFRPSALHFMEHGCYTFLRPNSNPNSEYRKFWDEEIRRCYEGYVRESDGEWVTGFCYWFLNYCPMLVNIVVEGSKKAIRKESFPFFFEGIYWRFHYLWQARESGKHAIELAKRGCAKSYSLAAIMSHNLILGESEESKRRIITVLTAYQKEYLSDSKDGTLSKFKPEINFIFTNTPFPRLMLKNSPNEMTWQMGYKDEFGVEKGSLNQVLAVSAKDDPEKLRGKRGWILFEEMGCHIEGTEVLMYDNTFKKVEDIQNGDLLKGVDGSSRIVSNVHSGLDQMYKITLSNGDWHIVNSKHLVHFKRHIWYKDTDEYLNIPAEDLYKWKDLQGCYIQKANIQYPKKDVRIDPYLLGLWLGDGDSNYISIANEDVEVLEWLKANYNGHLIDLKQSETCKVFYVSTKESLYEDFRYYNLFGNKHIPEDYIYNDAETGLQLLAGLIDTDGNLSVKKHSSCFEITQRYDRKHILDAAKAIATNLGLRCTMSHRISTGKKPGVLHYRLRISGDISIIPTKINRKKAPKQENKYKSRRCWQDYTFKIELYEESKYYGFEVDKDHLFILKDGTITHNSFKGLLSLYDITRKSVEDGNYTFATQYLVGTAAEDESDFSSAKTLLYNPSGYNIYSIENVFDRPNQGKQTFGFFFPSYINRAGCYNRDGVSDVVKALIEILLARYSSKYSADPRSVLRVIAEDPITPAEAIIKVKSAYFPVQALTERLAELDTNPSIFNDIYVGNLLLDSNGEVKFLPTNVEPIRKYGVDNSHVGAIEIFQMPEKNNEDKVYPNRYIIGHDPVDNDEAESSSLSSTFVLDLYTDQIVAEYTGRHQFAEENYEIVRLLCLFYNAKCLYEAHPYSQTVYTPEGIKTWGEIKKGDTLFSPTKGTVKVIDIPVDEEMPIYKVTLQDGRVIYSSDNHIWLVYEGTSKTPIEKTTMQMLEEGILNKHNQHKFFIPEHCGVDYNHRELPIDPYTMGLILSEGSLRGNHCTKNIVQISSSKEDMLFYERNIPYKCKFIGTKGYSWHIYIEGCKKIMQNYNLYNTNSHTKFIPTDYLQSSFTQRMELLKGLMDGDGCAVTKGASIFITCSEQLANNILTLVRSLGIKGWIQSFKNGVYRVAIASRYKIFKLPRKVVEQHVYMPYTKGSKASAILNKTAIKSIEYSHMERGKCVTVDSDDGLYLIGDYVVTHNCNKKGLFAYFSKLNCTHLLADTPEYLRDKQLIKYSSFGSAAKGVNATAAINNYANNLLRDWLLKPIPVIIEEGGESKEIAIPNLYRIKNRALLEELINYTPELNVDRIRALGMVMLYREEKMILYQGNPLANKEEIADASYLGNDPFFRNNYDLRIKSKY